jgi:hypothetical protein
MKWRDWIQKQLEENPGQVAFTAIAAFGLAVKAIDVLSQAQGRRAYAKQVNYRVRSRR